MPPSAPAGDAGLAGDWNSVGEEDSLGEEDSVGDGESVGEGGGRGSWKKELAAAIRDPDELISALGLDEALRAPARAAAERFSLVVPRSLLARMRPGDPGDPILRQVLPLAAELDERVGFVADPLAERAAQRAPGLLIKYPGRALLIASARCAVNCRYCFRRTFAYEETPRGISAWEPALRSIGSDPSLREVILSGGDPLVLPDELLARLVARLAAIPHVRRVRIHSRLPIVLPARVDAGLLEWLRASSLPIITVVHANHPAEIDAHCARALRRLISAGTPVLNQAVLLAGVNDDADTLAELCERLADLGVVSYYLHQLDRVEGTAHFEVPVERGLAIHEELRARLSGWALPRYVREEAGARSKTEVRPTAGEAAGGVW